MNIHATETRRVVKKFGYISFAATSIASVI
jgi:hypothetical protein